MKTAFTVCRPVDDSAAELSSSINETNWLNERATVELTTDRYNLSRFIPSRPAGILRTRAEEIARDSEVKGDPPLTRSH